jgi:hypothetical protein
MDKDNFFYSIIYTNIIVKLKNSTLELGSVKLFKLIESTLWLRKNLNFIIYHQNQIVWSKISNLIGFLNIVYWDFLVKTIRAYIS